MDRYTKNPGEIFHQGRVCLTFYGPGSKPDFQCVAVQAHRFRTFSTRLYMQGEGKALPFIIIASPDVLPDRLHQNRREISLSTPATMNKSS